MPITRANPSGRKFTHVASQGAAEPEVEEVVVEGAELAVPEKPTPTKPKRDKSDWVKISLHTVLQPAPRVGQIDMVRDFNISKLSAGINLVPPVVADVLVDKGLATRV